MTNLSSEETVIYFECLISLHFTNDHIWWIKFASTSQNFAKGKRLIPSILVSDYFLACEINKKVFLQNVS